MYRPQEKEKRNRQEENRRREQRRRHEITRGEKAIMSRLDFFCWRLSQQLFSSIARLAAALPSAKSGSSSLSIPTPPCTPLCPRTAGCSRSSGEIIRSSAWDKFTSSFCPMANPCSF